MPNKSIKQNVSSPPYDPTSLLQAAIEQIDVFTQDAASLDIAENGKLVALNTIGLERVVCLARNFIGPIFFKHIRQKQELKLNQIKNELLHARDVIQSHSQLIEQFKSGNSHQQKLALWALEAIKRYNALVDHNFDKGQQRINAYNYERQQLLLDVEIKGQQIRLPHAISIKYDSHSNSPAVQNTMRQLSQAFSLGSKDCAIATSTHKKHTQVMIDTFRMKAIRKIQQDLGQEVFVAEILSLVKQTPINIDETCLAPLMQMRQVIEMAPGSILTLTAVFERPFSGAKLMSIPILKELHLRRESMQTGFPYPSQHLTCALSDFLVDANPLRSEKVPLFSHIEQRKKKLAQDLLFDAKQINRAKQLHQLNKESIHANVQAFICLHRKLMQAIMQAAARPVLDVMLDDFYGYVATTSSCFETLACLQQQILDIAIIQPVKCLQAGWLSGDALLRHGASAVKLDVAVQILQTERQASSLSHLPLPIRPLMHVMIEIFGEAAQAIVLQYMSEKIGFAPIKLSKFEQKIQSYAFEQLLTFLEELEDKTFESGWASIESKMQAYCHLFDSGVVEASLATQIGQELQHYFDTRFSVSTVTHK